MPQVSQANPLKLSICITTLNRGAFIGETLDSILHQFTNECEVVVVDAASTDNTKAVVAERAAHCSNLRYVRQETNNGMDRDYDYAVELASGEYCWLMTDDDLLRPGAVAKVLCALKRDFSLLILNAESRDFSMKTVLNPRWLPFEVDRIYRPGDLDDLIVDAGHNVRYAGAIVVKRSIWLSRERQRYYGTLWLFVGVIFQAPLPTESAIIAEPLVSYRMSNTHTFSTEEVIFGIWPPLVESLALSRSSRRRILGAEPWHSLEWLLFWRGAGVYSRATYKRWILPRLRSRRQALFPLLSLVPRELANTILVVYYSLLSHEVSPPWNLHWLQHSPYYFRKWRIFNRLGAR